VVYFQTNTGTTGWRQSYADRVVVISPERLVLQFLDKIFGLSYLYPTAVTPMINHIVILYYTLVCTYIHVYVYSRFPKCESN
jgi:hypothetical protein